MTPRELFKLIIDLENDLADFYQEIGKINHLNAFADTFSFMADHSQRHARRIEKTARSTTIPTLDAEPANALHQRLKSSLLEQLREEKDGETVMRKLAQTEEVVGRLYQSMADHYRKQAGCYTAIAGLLDELSREEYGHRDYILEK